MVCEDLSQHAYQAALHILKKLRFPWGLGIPDAAYLYQNSTQKLRKSLSLHLHFLHLPLRGALGFFKSLFITDVLKY